MFLRRGNPPADPLDRLVERVAIDTRTDRERAARIVLYALLFRIALTRSPRFPHTAEYAKFCARIAIRLIHHRRFLRSARTFPARPPRDPGRNTGRLSR